MTEEERIDKGLLFASEVPELVAKKEKAHRLSQDYNALYETDREARRQILAWLPDEIREKTIESLNLQRYTENTIVDREALRREMDLTHRRGYAIDQQEYRKSLVEIGLPIFDARDNLVASISMGIDKLDLSDYSYYIGQLQDAGKKIMGRLGRT